MPWKKTKSFAAKYFYRFFHPKDRTATPSSSGVYTATLPYGACANCYVIPDPNHPGKCFCND